MILNNIISNQILKVLTTITIASRTQISTSVWQTTAVVALLPAAVTLWAASLVSVNQDTLEMDLPAQVNNIFCMREW